MNRRTVQSVSLGLLALALLAVAGCNRPLLSPDDTRTPFDAYDSQRGQYATQDLSDPFGRQKPNLTQRLAPKN